MCGKVRHKISSELGQGSGLRPCIARLGPEDFAASNSLAKLAFDNEVAGHRQFKCVTLVREGWCLGEECSLFNSSVVETGVVRRPFRYPVPSVPRRPQSHTPRQGRVPDHIPSDWDSLKQLEPITKRFKRFGGVKCP